MKALAASGVVVAVPPCEAIRGIASLLNVVPFEVTIPEPGMAPAIRVPEAFVAKKGEAVTFLSVIFPATSKAVQGVVVPMPMPTVLEKLYIPPPVPNRTSPQKRSAR